MFSIVSREGVAAEVQLRLEVLEEIMSEVPGLIKLLLRKQMGTLSCNQVKVVANFRKEDDLIPHNLTFSRSVTKRAT